MPGKYNESLISNLFSSHNSYNPFTLAHKMDVRIYYGFLGEGVYGKTTYPFNRKVICLNEDLLNQPELFLVCAHELFHILKHTGKTRYYLQNKYVKTKIEREANIFAIELAMKHYSQKYREIPNFIRLQDHYGVPDIFKEYFELLN